HYHSDMSPKYLEATYSSFASSDGLALILSATSGAGEGLDVPEVNGVINFGLPKKVPMRFQWEGRAGHSSTRDAFALTMLEPWVLEMSMTHLGQVAEDEDDPYRPLLSTGLGKKNPIKQERVGTAAVQLATCPGCKRAAYAKFMEDESDDGSSKLS
ncbi:hypothetical protein B0H17DRAFT_861354, partial [Mycena rosella]